MNSAKRGYYKHFEPDFKYPFVFVVGAIADVTVGYVVVTVGVGVVAGIADAAAGWVDGPSDREPVRPWHGSIAICEHILWPALRGRAEADPSSGSGRPLWPAPLRSSVSSRPIRRPFPPPPISRTLHTFESNAFFSINWRAFGNWLQQPSLPIARKERQCSFRCTAEVTNQHGAGLCEHTRTFQTRKRSHSVQMVEANGMN